MTEAEKKAVDEKIKGYKQEITAITQKAMERARAKKLEEIRQQINTAEGEEREGLIQMLINPSVIEVKAEDFDFGDDAKKLAELTGYIQNPDKVSPYDDETNEFIASMKGFSERAGFKETKETVEAEHFTPDPNKSDEENAQDEFCAQMRGYSSRQLAAQKK